MRCVFPEVPKNYDAFYEALTFMTGLRCKKICREGVDTETSCSVRGAAGRRDSTPATSAMHSRNARASALS